MYGQDVPLGGDALEEFSFPIVLSFSRQSLRLGVGIHEKLWIDVVPSPVPFRCKTQQARMAFPASIDRGFEVLRGPAT
jgi:hypothetical protein